MGRFGRRQLLIAAGAILAAPFAASQPERVRRVGVVFTAFPVREMAGPVPSNAGFRVFLNEMRALGWIEGRNLVLERRSAEGDFERAPAIFSELAQAGMEVIFTVSGPFARAAMKAAPATPIVMTAHSPVEEGLAQSLARPGGNVTGLALDVGPELHGKIVEILRELVPKAKRVAYLTTQGAGGTVAANAIRSAASASGLDLFDAEWSDNKFDAAFRLIESRRPDALVVSGIPPHLTRLAEIVAFARKMRLPDIHQFLGAVNAGGLCAHGVSLGESLRKAAGYVDRILRGARPAELPIERPTRVFLEVNLKTAKALGLTIPQSILTRAERVVE